MVESKSLSLMRNKYINGLYFSSAIANWQVSIAFLSVGEPIEERIFVISEYLKNPNLGIDGVGLWPNVVLSFLIFPTVFSLIFNWISIYFNYILANETEVREYHLQITREYGSKFHKRISGIFNQSSQLLSDVGALKEEAAKVMKRPDLRSEDLFKKIDSDVDALSGKMKQLQNSVKSIRPEILINRPSFKFSKK